MGDVTSSYASLNYASLDYVSWIAPARWGMAALASTINLNVIQAQAYQSTTGQKADTLWTHSASHWMTAIVVMIGLGIVWLIIARLRLATIGPRKRKEKKSTAPNSVRQPVGV